MSVQVVPDKSTFVRFTGINVPDGTFINVTESLPLVLDANDPPVPIYKTAP